MTSARICNLVAALRTNDGLTLTASVSGESAQYAEPKAIKLVIGQSVKENQSEVYLFSDSWTVANLIPICSRTWKELLKIRNKDRWGKDI